MNKRQPITNHFVLGFLPKAEPWIRHYWIRGEIYSSMVEEFLRYGVKTKRGFQRISRPPMFIVQLSHSYRIYQDDARRTQ